MLDIAGNIFKCTVVWMDLSSISIWYIYAAVEYSFVSTLRAHQAQNELTNFLPRGPGASNDHTVIESSIYCNLSELTSLLYL